MILSYVTNGLLLAAVMSWFLPIGKYSPATRWMLLAIPFVLLFIPLGNFTLNGFIFTVTAQLSVPTLMLLFSYVGGRYFQAPVLAERERSLLLWSVAVLAPGFYIMALGYGPFSPYSWGFPGGPAVYALFALVLLSWLFRYYGIALALAIVVVAPVIPLGESTNVSNYLVDVWLAIYAIAWAISRLVRLFWGRFGFGFRQQ